VGIKNSKVIDPSNIPDLGLKYQRADHVDLPHVVKFSGGRSSALMLLALLDNGHLSAKRGDVIVFNNTSAEHPETYKFTVLCKKIAELQYGIPFFLTEFLTYEDAFLGRWRRVPSYRLVKPFPNVSYANRTSYGYHYKGEVFEDFVSWKSQLPTRFARTCTQFLKLHTSTSFIADWFGRCDHPDQRTVSVGNQTNGRLGHYYGETMMPSSEAFKDRSEIVKYHLDRPTSRPPQRYRDFTDAPLIEFDNPHISRHVYDRKAILRGEDSIRFISFVGLRGDEPRRAANLFLRNNTSFAQGKLADGEFVYAPLFDEGYAKEDVLQFWRDQSFDLDIDHNTNLSNCVHCFMKGTQALKQLARVKPENEGPSDIRWWADLEDRYARRVTSTKENNTISKFGFFGRNSISYREIIASSEQRSTDALPSSLPCECTD